MVNRGQARDLGSKSLGLQSRVLERRGGSLYCPKSRACPMFSSEGSPSAQRGKGLVTQ